MPSLGKKNYSEEVTLPHNLGMGEQKRKENKYEKEGFVGRKPASSPDAERSQKKSVTHAVWELWSDCRERLPGELSWAGTPITASSHPARPSAFQTGEGGTHAQITQCHASRCLSTSWDHEGQSTGRKGLCDFPRDFLFFCAF